jgi:anti-sigma factor RsiW
MSNLKATSHPHRAVAGRATTPHANFETLGLYLLGDLSLNTTLVTEQHLSSCPGCKRQLRQAAAVVAALRA